MASRTESIVLQQLKSMVERDHSTPLDPSGKATQPHWRGLSPREVARRAETISTLSTPLLTLDRTAVAHNIAVMHEWVNGHGASLAPHGKTTMLPAVWLAQLEAGAWAITVANEPQLRAAIDAGVPRIILANLLVRPAAIQWLASIVRDTQHVEVYCWVDSPDAVELLHQSLEAVDAGARVNVLVEIGEVGVRTGARDLPSAISVARLASRSPHLRLVGVAGFEGVLIAATRGEQLSTIDNFLLRMIETLEAVADLCEGPELLLTAGGSSYFDRVLAVLTAATIPGRSVRVVVRSGGYVTHDDGVLDATGPHTRHAGPRFRPALHLWARVLSVPDPGFAVLDAGRRDAPYDAGLPVCQVAYGPGPSPQPEELDARRYTVAAMNDQHLLLRTPLQSTLRVGAMVRFGISHPCTALDKWSNVPVIDDAARADPTVVDILTSRF